MKPHEVNEIIKKLGIKKNHIAKQIECSPSQLSHFLGGYRPLPAECYTRLVNYLKV